MKILKITQSEWLKLGEKLFGKDKSRWQFLCPACGGVQTHKEFEVISSKYKIHTTAVMTVCKKYLLSEDKEKVACAFNTIDHTHPYLFWVSKNNSYSITLPFNMKKGALKRLSGKTS